jgi:predicted PurR-regulated permease PerM
LFLIVRVLDDFIFLPLTIGRKLHVHPVLSLLVLYLGASVAGATGLVLALPVFGVVAVIGEAVAQIVTDERLMARYRLARQNVNEACRKTSGAH